MSEEKKRESSRSRAHDVPARVHVEAGQRVHHAQRDVDQPQPNHVGHRERRQIVGGDLGDVADDQRQHDGRTAWSARRRTGPAAARAGICDSRE